MDEKEDPLLRTMSDASSGPGEPRARSPDLLQREWEAFKQRHRLQPRLLAPPAEPPVPGTGGDTPL